MQGSCFTKVTVKRAPIVAYTVSYDSMIKTNGKPPFETTKAFNYVNILHTHAAQLQTVEDAEVGAVNK